MAHLISFRTTKFNVRVEIPNPINPIAGQSVLNWLRAQLTNAGYAATEPGTEDWGWYMDVEADGASYLVGASADAESSSPTVEWVVQVHKHRSITDKLLGRNQMATDDPLVTVVERIVRADAEILDVTVERNV